MSFTISRSLLKLLSIESTMPSNHLILYCPLFLLPSIFLSIRVFSRESALHIRGPKYWSFSFSISPMKTSCTISLNPSDDHFTFYQGLNCGFRRSVLAHSQKKYSQPSVSVGSICRFNQPQMKHIGRKILESAKKQNLNLLYVGNSLHST